MRWINQSNIEIKEKENVKERLVYPRTNISMNIAVFSRHASRTSDRFIRPMKRKTKEGSHHVSPLATNSQKRRDLLVGTSSTSFGAWLMTLLWHWHHQDGPTQAIRFFRQLRIRPRWHSGGLRLCTRLRPCSPASHLSLNAWTADYRHFLRSSLRLRSRWILREYIRYLHPQLHYRPLLPLSFSAILSLHHAAHLPPSSTPDTSTRPFGVLAYSPHPPTIHSPLHTSRSAPPRLHASWAHTGHKTPPSPYPPRTPHCASRSHLVGAKSGLAFLRVVDRKSWERQNH